MNHYTAEQWSDYVRGLGTDREQMRAHLESCARCQEQVTWLEKVKEMAWHDANLEVPADVLARATGIFPKHPEPEGWMERLQQIAAELVTGNPRQYQPAGLRAAADDSVRLLYRAGNYVVDLSVEPPASEGASEIIGQISNESDSQDLLEGLVVQTVADGRTLVQTETNQFGEFVIEQPGSHGAVLRIALKRYGKRIDLPLRDQFADHN